MLFHIPHSLLTDSQSLEVHIFPNYLDFSIKKTLLATTFLGIVNGSQTQRIELERFETTLKINGSN